MSRLHEEEYGIRDRHGSVTRVAEEADVKSMLLEEVRRRPGAAPFVVLRRTITYGPWEEIK